MVVLKFDGSPNEGRLMYHLMHSKKRNGNKSCVPCPSINAKSKFLPAVLENASKSVWQWGPGADGDVIASQLSMNSTE